METENKQNAMIWWESLHIDSQYELASKVYPTWKFKVVSASHLMIERIYNQYKNEK
jgi:hypothetical protein